VKVIDGAVGQENGVADGTDDAVTSVIKPLRLVIYASV